MKPSKIASAMEYLDDDLIVAAAQEKNGVRAVKRERKPFFSNGWRRWVAVVAAAVLLMTGGVVTGSIVGKNQTVAVVAFDVNPSIEIELNGKQKVKKVNALNEAARVVLEKMDFEGVGLDITVNALIGSMLKHGYLSVDQNSILISVQAKDGEQAATLQRNISENVSALLLGSNIQASVMTQSFDRTNGAGDISAAKAALIQKIVAAGLTRLDGSKYTYEQLAGLHVHELKLMLESKGFSSPDIELSGKANEGKYIGEEQALAGACQHAEVAVDSAKEVEIELDFDDDRKAMIYEVEFVYGDFEYEYELDAVSGAILEYEKEPND